MSTAYENAARDLAEILGEGSVLTQAALKNYTSFRIGGPADVFAEPAEEETLTQAVAYVRERGIPYFIMGNGTNILAADEGYRGVVIKLGRAFSKTVCSGNEIRVLAGTLLGTVASEAAEKGLDGFAFAAGIPGSFGGACIMNAGAYGGEMKDVLTRVRVLGTDGTVRDVYGEEMGLGYRQSGFAKRNEIVLEGWVRLAEGDPRKIRARIEELAAQRREKQPLTYPSAGSTFKRPEGYYAGKLISDAGLKGYRIGGAMVSEKHAGFIINDCGATAADVAALISHVRSEVYREFGVELVPEVRFLGDVWKEETPCVL